MNILILGGSGFIGSHLADRIVQLGHQVSIFHQQGASRKNNVQIEKSVRFIEGDFQNAEVISHAVKGAEIVVHLIGATLPGSSLSNPVYDVEMNVVSSINLFERCVKAGVRKVIFVSSGGTVYGIPQECPIAEFHPTNPIVPYGISKLAIEKYLGMYHYQYGLDYSILRLANPFGSRQDPYRGQGVIAAWMQRILMDEPVEIWGDGAIVRDYIYIADAVRAIESAMFSTTREKIFNVGSGLGHSLIELHRVMENQLGRSIQTQLMPLQKVDVSANILNIELIARELKWSPQLSLEQGIKKLWGEFVAYPN